MKQLLPKVDPPCVGAELPPRTQHVPLPERASLPQGPGGWSRLEQGWGSDSRVSCVCVSENANLRIKKSLSTHKTRLAKSKILDGILPSGVGLFLWPPHPVPPQQRIQLWLKPRDHRREEELPGYALLRLITLRDRQDENQWARAHLWARRAGGAVGRESSREGIKRSGEWALLPNTLVSAARHAVICCP